MISDNQSICPKCGGQLKYYDHVQRLVRTKFGNKKWVAIRRLRCCKCHAVHREIPDFIFPYKQYEADIIIGVLEGKVSKFYCPVCCKDRYITWSDLRKKIVYEGSQE